MKKLVSVALVLCMVLALIPAMAFAASPVAMVGQTGYATVQEAIDAASAPGATTNRVDIVADVPTCTIVIKSDVVIQLNGHTVSGTTGSYADLPFNIVSPTATLTLQGPGTVMSDSTGTQTKLALLNTGKLVIEKGVKISGVIGNTGEVTQNEAYLKGFYDNTGSVTVNGGGITAPTGEAVFQNSGKVTVNFAQIHGVLDDKKACPGLTVNGGAFNDVHVIKHTSAPVAGLYGGTIPLAPLDSYNPYLEYWVGAKAMVAYANAYYNDKYKGSVDFLVGDAKVDGMPTYSKGWSYWDCWDSYYDGAEQKAIRDYLDVDKDGVKEYPLTGRGLVNGLSDLNITASKYAVSSTDPIASSVLTSNALYVTDVKATVTGVNKNEVFVTIDITADLANLSEFTTPEITGKFGNNNGRHAWVPITLKFTDLNGQQVNVSPNVDSRDAWNTAFTYGNTSNSNVYHIWVGVDHNALGQNSSFDFADMRYYSTAGHGLIYRCTIAVHDAKASVPENSEPDDTTGAAAIPSGSGSTPAATTKPAGTGAGDGPAKTGDNSTVMLWATLLVASAAGVAICVVDEAKKRSRK